MKKIILIIIMILLVTSCNKRGDEQIIKDSDKVSKVKIIINGEEYIFNLEDNNTVRKFINILPLNITMNELNGNEKYVYLDEIFETNTYKPNIINRGDVMLYSDNCLVIFYKTFNTSYSYTKIGHIDNLPELDDKSINVSISKY